MDMNHQLDPSASAKNVYKLINEKNHMRVLKVTFEPGAWAKMHHHPQHMAKC